MSAVKYKPKVIQINTIVRHIYKYFVRESKRDNVYHNLSLPLDRVISLFKKFAHGNTIKRSVDYVLSVIIKYFEIKAKYLTSQIYYLV